MRAIALLRPKSEVTLLTAPFSLAKQFSRDRVFRNITVPNCNNTSAKLEDIDSPIWSVTSKYHGSNRNHCINSQQLRYIFTNLFCSIDHPHFAELVSKYWMGQGTLFNIESANRPLSQYFSIHYSTLRRHRFLSNFGNFSATDSATGPISIYRRCY